jgi:hypothetical protein
LKLLDSSNRDLLMMLFHDLVIDLARRESYRLAASLLLLRYMRKREDDEQRRSLRNRWVAVNKELDPIVEAL